MGSEWARPNATPDAGTISIVDKRNPESGSQTQYDRVAGTEYFLPKRLYEITFTRKIAKEKDLKAAKKAVKNASASLAAAENESNKNAKEKKTQELLKKHTTGSSARKDVVKSFEKAEGKAGASAETKSSADAALDNALHEYVKKAIPAVLDREKCVYNVTMKIKDLGLVPDTRYRYVARLRHSIFRADELKLSTTANGLLSNATGTADDKSGEIIVAIAEGVAAFATGFPKVVDTQVFQVATVGKPETGKVCDTADLTRKFIVDLNDSETTHGYGAGAQLEEFLQSKLIPSEPGRYALRVAPAWQAPQSVADTDKPCKKNLCNGLFYRRDLPYVVSLEKCGTKLTSATKDSKFSGCGANANINMVAATALVNMPNGSPIARVELPSAPLVKTEHTVEFENGMLVSHDMTRPSEMLELATLPIKVANAMMSVVTNFVKLRVDHVSQQTALSEGELAYLEALKDLSEAKSKQNDDSEEIDIVE